MTAYGLAGPMLRDVVPRMITVDLWSLVTWVTPHGGVLRGRSNAIDYSPWWIAHSVCVTYQRTTRHRNSRWEPLYCCLYEPGSWSQTDRPPVITLPYSTGSAAAASAGDFCIKRILYCIVLHDQIVSRVQNLMRKMFATRIVYIELGGK